MLTRTRIPRLAGVALAASLAACGGGTTDPTPIPTPTPAPTPKPPYVVSQLTAVTLEAEYVGWLPFTTTERGALDVTVDWTYAANDLDVYLGQGSCDGDSFDTPQCPLVAYSESSTAKPEKVHFDNAVAGTYTIFVGNAGPGDEAVSFQVVLTPSATAAASTRAVRGVNVQPRIRPRGFVELK